MSIAKIKISTGVVHTVPTDVRALLTAQPALLLVWNDITPLARNEWICWIESAKQLETRHRRMRIMSENLLAGKRRPCCWAGCPHR
jgi:uncharacterized protein YdeI (YjbR/CyaY-like superfamily)